MSKLVEKARAFAASRRAAADEIAAALIETLASRIDTYEARGNHKISTADLAGMAEIAALAEVSPQAVANWRNRHFDFPEPVAVLTCGPVWHRREVETWLERRRSPRMTCG